jgi:nitric-oxide synthase, brain
MYVQELAEKEGNEIHDLLVNRGAHFYVCGDCKMAEDVHQKLKGIIKKHGNLTDEQTQNFMFMLKVHLILSIAIFIATFIAFM